MREDEGIGVDRRRNAIEPRRHADAADGVGARVHRSAEDADIAADRHGGRAADEPRGGKPARATREGLAEAQSSSSTRPPRRCFCRIILIAGRTSVPNVQPPSDLKKPIQDMKKFVAVLLLLVVVGGGARRRCPVHARQPACIAASRRASSSSRYRRAAGRSAIGERLARAGVVRDPVTFRAALWMSHQGRHLKAGEYRFDRAMTPFEVIDKMARGDVFVISVTFPGRADDRGDGEDLRDRTASGPAASFVQAARRIRRRFTTSIRRQRISRAICFRRPMRCRAARMRRSSSRMMVARFEKVFTPELRQAAAGAQPDACARR